MPGGIVMTESISMKQKGTTQIKRGDVVLFATATDAEEGDRAAAVNAAKVAGVAIYDSKGQDDVVECVRRGRTWVKNTSGGAISQGDVLVSHTDGGVIGVTTEDPINVVGIALEDSADDDLFYADINPIVNDKT